MRRIAWDTSFRRAFKRKARKNSHLRQRMLEVLELLSQDVFDPPLKTHKLRGQLEGLWACWVEYDCRIVFAFESDPESDEDMIVLIDIGTHDEVLLSRRSVIVDGPLIHCPLAYVQASHHRRRCAGV
ncbi:MAG: type II toxin-antitoxin system mRNA interferase toxin, RelE/StbE family [Anaerolineae bacterium]|nr:type II toxin-antitoxin system mRNA interferase toxin, RelE/StbE family [Anaerolineae bacterium]